MKGRKAGKAMQDEGGGGVTKWYNSIKTGKVGGKTQTASVASPNSLKVGTKEGRGGTQMASPGDIACDGQRAGGGYIVPLKKG